MLSAPENLFYVSDLTEKSDTKAVWVIWIPMFQEVEPEDAIIFETDIQLLKLAPIFCEWNPPM